MKYPLALEFKLMVGEELVNHKHFRLLLGPMVIFWCLVREQEALTWVLLYSFLLKGCIFRYCLHLKMSLEVKYPTCQSNWYLLCWPLKCLFKSEGFFLEMTLIQMNPFMNHLTRTSTVKSPLEVVKQFWLCANFLT